MTPGLTVCVMLDDVMALSATLCAVSTLVQQIKPAAGDEPMLELISETRALPLIAHRQMIALNRPGVWES